MAIISKVFLTLVIVLIVLPVFLTFFLLPLLLWRFAVVILARLVRKDFLRATSVLSNFYTVDKIYEKPVATLLGIEHFDGEISYAEAKKRTEDLISSGKRPELECCLRRWLGINFLQKQENFKLENHVISHQESIDDTAFEKIVDKMVEDPWETGRPLWEIHVFTSHKNAALNTVSSIVFRFHHSLMDGVSSHFLSTDLSDYDPKHEEEIAEFVTKLKDKYTPSLLQKVLAGFYLLFFSPFLSVYRLIGATESNIWTPKESEMSGETSSIMSVDDIDLKWVKNLAKIMKRNVTLLLAEALTSAIREHFKETSGTFPSANVHSKYPIPGPGHPGKHRLTNNFIVECVTLPISEPSREKRLDILSAQFRRMMTTPQPLGTQAFGYLLALLVGAMGKPPQRIGGQLGTLIFSNVLLYGRPLKFCGANNVCTIPQAGLQTKDNSFFFASTSYNGRVGLVMRADKKLFPDKESCKFFVGRVVKALQEMEEETMAFQIKIVV